MQLLAVDRDPGAKALPVITHDLELSCDGQQLRWRRVTNFYCEFFHISFIVSAGP